MSPTHFAIPDAERAGAIVWWRLSGVTSRSLLANRLTSVFPRHQLEFLLKTLTIPQTSPHEAIRVAMQSVSTPRRLVRSLPRQSGLALVEETPCGNDLEYRTLIKAHIDEDIDENLVTLDDGGNNERQLCADVRKAYYDAHETLQAAQIGSWLSQKVMPACRAVALRQSGGIYFIPRDGLWIYHLVSQAIHDGIYHLGDVYSEHKLYEVPALKSEEAVSAVLDALIAEAESVATGIEAELTDDSALGARALRTREETARALASKISSYETLLGQAVPQLHERLSQLQTMITAAMLAASAEAAE